MRFLFLTVLITLLAFGRLFAQEPVEYEYAYLSFSNEGCALLNTKDGVEFLTMKTNSPNTKSECKGFTNSYVVWYQERAELLNSLTTENWQYVENVAIDILLLRRPKTL